MYFELSRQSNIDFPIQFKVGNLVLSTDLGWKETAGEHGKIIYKGYAYQDLSSFLTTHDPSTLETIHGSFTAIMQKGNHVHVVTDNTREFPIYFDRDKIIVTNLTKHNETAWPDTHLQIDCENKIVRTRYNEMMFDLGSKKDLVTTTNTVLDILNNSVKSYIDRYKDPIRIVPTGGLDSTLMIGLLKKNNANFEVIDYEYKKWTYFRWKNGEKIKKENGPWTRYGHTWGATPVTLAHGWMGDQYFFRDYLPLAVLCKIKNINLKEEFKRFEGSYCFEHLREDMENRESSWLEITKEIVDEKSAYKKIFEIIRGSFLWWTFEKTTYWSPFKDLEILKHVLHLSEEDLLQNAFRGTIQSKMLEIVDPNLLDCITEKKNKHEFNESMYAKYTDTLLKY
tara:strand:- start:7442 stop:8626 length:1185 start_codon:yes stop_codon:yes gene_type:complete